MSRLTDEPGFFLLLRRSPRGSGRLSSLVARKLASQRRAGRRRTRRVGAGIETIDLRPYAVGDDTRRIAWHAYARLEKLLIRLVADEAPLRLVLVVDQSGSMSYGMEDQPNKLRQAARIAAGFAAVALGGEDRDRGRGRSTRDRSQWPPTHPRDARSPRAGGQNRPRDRRAERAASVGPGKAKPRRHRQRFSSSRTASSLARGKCAAPRPRRRAGGGPARRSRSEAARSSMAWTSRKTKRRASSSSCPKAARAGAVRRSRSLRIAPRSTRPRASMDAAVVRTSTSEPFETIVTRALQAGLFAGGAS